MTPSEPAAGTPRCCPIATHFVKPTSRYFTGADCHASFGKGRCVTMGVPVLPIDHKALTPHDAADLLNGLAALVEAYPTTKVLLSVQVEIPTTSDATKSPGKGATKAPVDCSRLSILLC